MPVFLDCNLDFAPQSRWNTISPTATARSSLLYALDTGELFAGPNFHTTQKEFDSYMINMTVDGCGQLEYDGQVQLIPPGHFFLVDRRKKQHCHTAPGFDNWNCVWVHFSGANAKAYYDAFLTHNNGSHIGIFPVSSKALDILTMLLELDNTGKNQIMVDFQAASLLSQLLSECVLSTMTAGKTSNVPEIIQGVRMFLLNHYPEKHTLEGLGTRFNINPYYLQKQFKHHVGMSPSEYQIHLRISKAKEMIRSSKQSIGQIAYAVGIENLGYFTRLFKKREGITPQEYRKLWPLLEHPPQELSSPEGTHFYDVD